MVQNRQAEGHVGGLACQAFVEGDREAAERDACHRRLRQAEDRGGGDAQVADHDVLHRDGAEARRAVGDGGGVAGLDPIGAAVGVAVVEGVDGDRRADPLHHRSREEDAGDRAAPAAARLDAQPAVGVAEVAVDDVDVRNVAAHLRADDHAAVAPLQQAVADGHAAGGAR